MAGEFFQAQWGRHKLWASRVTTDNGRRQVIQELSSGDEHPVQDRGLKPRRVTLELLFDDFPEESSTPTNRFRSLKADVDAGTRAIYTHPIDGGFLARVGSFDYDIDANSVITNARIEFIADEAIDAVQPAGAGATSISGEGAIEQAADDLDAALAAAGLDGTDLTATAKSNAADWQDAEDLSTRQVIVDAAETAAGVGALIEENGLEFDLALFDVYRAAIMFADSVRVGAIAATSETPSVFVLRIVQPTSLLPLCARTYGGNEAEDRARQVTELNDIRTPGWLAPGEYLFPTKSTSTSVIF